MMHLAAVYAGCETRRWHANPALAATGQTIADHHGRCVLLLVMLNPSASPALIGHLALHDIGEAWAGDLAQPFKQRFPEIARTHAAAEAGLAEERLGFALPWLTEVETLWVKLIDKLDAAAYALFHAPAEYARPQSGWPAAETAILNMADRLGVLEPVLEFLGDLKGGRW